MQEIKLTKRYPQSRTEDITDAFMRGYEQGRTDGLKVGRQIILDVVDSYLTELEQTETTSRQNNRKTESSSEKPNNCTNCECTDDCTECKEAEHGCKDESQTNLCRECDDYAGDGMYCASNHIVYDFSTSKGNCEPQTERSSK